MTDLNINIKAPAIEKLVDYVASGVGAIAGPMLAPWRASREGEAKIISAQTDAKARIIQAESESKASLIIAKAKLEAKEFYFDARDEELLRTRETNRNDITQWVEFQERKRLANIKNVVSEAANMLADKEVADHEPDPDWTARFFNSVQDISSEDMHKIWAKILAGEVERPKSTSLRTMNILRNMTKRDAEMFEKIAGFVIGNGFIFYEGDYVRYINTNYGDILHLQNCGLINTQTFLTSNISSWRNGTKHILMYQGNVLEITKDINAEEVLKIPAIWLTEVGKELLLVVQGVTQMEYLQDFSRFLQSKNCQLFYLEDFETLPSGQFNYRKRIKIEPKSVQSRGSTA